MMGSGKLITSGCSFTQYCWPTWADYLGRHFHEHINVGLSGADNAVIARNAMATARTGDTVVVLWTGFDRFNEFSDDVCQESKMPGDLLVLASSGMTLGHTAGGWSHSGSVVGNRRFLVHHYHRIERFRHTLDYVKMLEMHSQLNDYRLWNFCMTNWFQGEIERTQDPRLVRMHQDMRFHHFVLDADLDTVRQNTLPLRVKHRYNEDDPHPTPLVHWIWARDYIAPEIGMVLDLAMESQVHEDQSRVLAGDI